MIRLMPVKRRTAMILRQGFVDTMTLWYPKDLLTAICPLTRRSDGVTIRGVG